MPTDEKVRIVVEADTQDFDKKLTKSQKRAKELNDQKLDALEKQFDSLDLGLKKFTKDQVKQVKVTKDQIKNLNLEKDSYFKLQAQMNLNSKILKSLSAEQVKNINIGGKLVKTINDQKTALKKFDDEIGDSFRKVGSYEDAIKKAFSGVKSGIGDGVVALSAFIEVGNQIIDVAASVYELSQQFNNANVTAQVLFDTVEGGTDNLAKEALKIADRWDEDVTEVLRTSSVVAKQFGIDGKAAMDLIRDGMQRGGFLADDDYLRQLKEYSSQMKNIGLDAEQTISILTQSVKEGVYSDKGLDALKEAGLSIREMTPVADKALKGIGLSGAKIQEEIVTGQKTVFDIIQEVSTKMGGFSAQSSAVGAVYADVFKGAGEDAGDFVLKLGSMSTELEDVDIQSNKMLDAQSKLSEAMVEFRSIVASLAQGLSGVVDFAGDAVNVFNRLFTGLHKGQTEAFLASTRFNQLSTTYETLATKTSLTAEEQRQLSEATQELQRLAPNTLQNLDDENILLKDKIKLLDQSSEAMLKQALAKIKEDELAEASNDLQNKIDKQASAQHEFKKKRAKDEADLAAARYRIEKGTNDNLDLLLEDSLETRWVSEDNYYFRRKEARQKDINEAQAVYDELTKLYSGGSTEEDSTKTALIKLVPDADDTNNELQLNKDTILKAATQINEEMPPPPDFVGVDSTREKLETVKDLIADYSESDEEIKNNKQLRDLGRIDEAKEAERERYAEAMRVFEDLITKQGQLTEAQLQQKQDLEKRHNKIMDGLQKRALKANLANVYSNTVATLANYKSLGLAAKRLTQAQALADTYASATAAYKSAADIPYVGWILGPIAAASAVAAGLSNVQKIENTKFSDGGVLQGPSHAEGGIQLGGNQEAEGDEIILTKAVYRSPEGRAQASALNQAFGGVAIPGASAKVPFMQDGGVVAGTQGQSLNMQEMTQRIDTTNMLLAQQSEKLSRIEAKTGVHFNDEVVGELSSSIDQSVYESTSRDNQEFQSIGR